MPKTGHNRQQGYDYVTDADVLAAVREKLAVRHVAFVAEVCGATFESIGETSNKAPKMLAQVRMTFTFIDGDSGESIQREFAGAGMDFGGEKGLYKAITGATKYFLMKTFLMPTGDDPESDHGVPAESAPVQRAQAQPGRSPDAPASDVVTSGQISMIWARGKEAGLSEEEIKETVRVKTNGVEHVAEIPKRKVDAVLEGFVQYAEFKKRQQPQESTTDGS
jgi:hypothetical protein